MRVGNPLIIIRSFRFIIKKSVSVRREAPEEILRSCSGAEGSAASEGQTSELTSSPVPARPPARSEERNRHRYTHLLHDEGSSGCASAGLNICLQVQHLREARIRRDEAAPPCAAACAGTAAARAAAGRGVAAGRPAARPSATGSSGAERGAAAAAVGAAAAARDGGWRTSRRDSERDERPSAGRAGVQLSPVVGGGKRGAAHVAFFSRARAHKQRGRERAALWRALRAWRS